MRIQFRVIASGSNGNAAYISSPDGTLIIDAGISRKRIISALQEDDIPLDSIIGILISHSHTDHCRGLPVLCDTLGKVPIFSSKGTKETFYSFKTYDSRWETIGRKSQTFSFGNHFSINDSFNILPLRTVHDTKDSSGFQISYHDTKISLITDTGTITPEHLEALNESSLILLEMNHDIKALKNSRRPHWLKKRIRESHLANSESTRVFESLNDSSTKAIFLGHLSGECNSPNLVGSEIQSWHLENSSSWNWYVCRRDISGKAVHFDGHTIKTVMEPLDPNRQDKKSQSTPDRVKLDEFF
ncbi:MAG: MBL fold metallo-hydrolase [Candidatus Hodarchaeales archaeon]